MTLTEQEQIQLMEAEEARQKEALKNFLNDRRAKQEAEQTQCERVRANFV